VFVVDSSVVVALFLAEDPGHDASRRWFESITLAGTQVAAPSLLLPEVAGSIRRVSGSIDRAMRAARSLVAQDVIRIEPLTNDLAARAAEIAAGVGLRGADAVYVAVAALLQFQLVTLDNQQFERGAAVVDTRRP